MGEEVALLAPDAIGASFPLAEVGRSNAGMALLFEEPDNLALGLAALEHGVDLVLEVKGQVGDFAIEALGAGSAALRNGLGGRSAWG